MATTQSGEGTGFKQDMDRLGQGVDTLRADVKTLAHGTADAARSGVAELRQGAHQAVDMAKDKLQDGKDAAIDAAESLKDVISRHPASSVGIAVGVGLLIGMVLSRPRS